MTTPFSARGPVLVGSLTVALLLGTTIFWGLSTDIEGAIVAPGQIQVESNRQIVQHPDGGVVASSISTNDYEQASVQVQTAGTYYIRVYGRSGAKNSYNLLVSQP